MTAKYKKIAIILGVLSILLTVGPMLAYITVGFLSAKLVVQKVTLAASVLFVGLLTIVSITIPPDDTNWLPPELTSVLLVIPNL